MLATVAMVVASVAAVVEHRTSTTAATPVTGAASPVGLRRACTWRRTGILLGTATTVEQGVAMTEC